MEIENVQTKVILLINGKKRCGKDYFSDILVNKGEYVKLAFATTLKEVACKVANIEFDVMEDLKNNGGKFEINKDDYIENIKNILHETLTQMSVDEKKEKYFFNLINIENYMVIDHQFNESTNILTFDARIFLQQIGGMWKEIFSNINIWTELLIEKINKIDAKNIIIADYRYPYEARLIKEYFEDRVVKTVKVLGINLYEMDKYDSHSSETALNDAQFDYHINNTFWDDKSIYWQAKGLIGEIDTLREEF